MIQQQISVKIMTKKKDLGILSDFEEMIPEENMDNSSFSFITEFKGNYEEELRDVNIPDELPILPLRNMVLFPTTVLPISVLWCWLTKRLE